MAQDTASRHLDQFLVRFPEGMRERIAEAAKANNRSMNAEIVSCLQESLSGNGGFDKETFANSLATSFIEASAKAFRSALPPYPGDPDPNYEEMYFEKSLIEWMRNNRVFISEANQYERDFFTQHGRFENAQLEERRIGSPAVEKPAKSKTKPRRLKHWEPDEPA